MKADSPVKEPLPVDQTRRAALHAQLDAILDSRVALCIDAIASDLTAILECVATVERAA